MYNLFVSFDEAAWDGGTFKLDIGRCVREYTDERISKQLGSLDDNSILEIKRLPCIFAYETGNNKPPRFGRITSVTKNRIQASIDYEIVEVENFPPHDALSQNAAALDIENLELYRTHWAVKDVDLVRELARLGVQLPEWAKKQKKIVDIGRHQFDVALSFPGEIRSTIEKIIGPLESEIGPDSYFYDNNYKSQLARPNLDVLLQDIYANRSKLIVVFLSSDYQKKEWCGLEFRAIRQIVMQKDFAKIMYVRTDDGAVDGVFNVDGYIDARNHTPVELAKFIIERVQLA